MLTIIKVFIILFYSPCGNREHPGNFQNKSVSSQLSVQLYYFLGQTEEERKNFFGACKKGTALLDYPQEHLAVTRDGKVCPSVKFEIILPLLCFLLDPLANKHCRAWSSIINL